MLALGLLLASASPAVASGDEHNCNGQTASAAAADQARDDAMVTAAHEGRTADNLNTGILEELSGANCGDNNSNNP